MVSVIKKIFLCSLLISSSLFSMETALTPLSVENAKDLISIFDHQKTVLTELVKVLPIISNVFPETSSEKIYFIEKTNQLENIISANCFYKKEVNALLPETLKKQTKQCKENLRQSAAILRESKKMRLEQETMIVEIERLQEKNKYSFSFCQTLTLILFSVSMGAYFF